MSSSPSFIAGVVLTKNEARHIQDCVASLAWCDLCLVWDSFSSDRTCALAQNAGATVIQHPWEHYAQQRNAALAWVKQHFETLDSAAPYAWVFFLDADERCPSALAQELRTVAQTDQHAVWSVPRDNYLFGNVTRGGGWYPDYQARLFLLGRSGYDPHRMVHEVAQFEGEMGYLRQTLTHYNYDNVAQFHEKQRRYTAYEAGILFKRGVRPKPQNFILQPLREFRRRFIQLKGYVDGWHGCHLALLMAYYNFDMYRRLRQMWRENG